MKQSYYIILAMISLFTLVIIAKVSVPSEIQESFKSNTLDKIYGHQCPRNPHTTGFDAIMTKWDQIATRANIPYSITYGTYLGWLRHQDYIPYDEDLDVHIGIESVSKLMAMKGKDGCCDSRDLSTHPLTDNVPKLVLYPYHKRRVDDQYRPRYDCSGKYSDSHRDNCAFNGPIARVIYRSKKKYLHLDIFVYHREDNEKKRQELQEKGLASDFYGPYGSYVSSTVGSQLPPVKPCRLHGLKTSCFRDGADLMTNIYGKNYLQPIKMWDESSHKWLNKNT